MKNVAGVLACLFFILGCKQHRTDQEQIIPSLSDSVINEDSTPVNEALIKSSKAKKKTVFDTILFFQTIERIFEDEFYLVFNNDSDEPMRFYFIPAFTRKIYYSFISESQGDFASNPQLAGKKFKISYSHQNHVNFTGETETANIIEHVLLLDSLEDETPEKLIHIMELEVLEMQNCIKKIDWKDAVPNDSSVILYDEDFKYPLIKNIHKVFTGFNDCSGDSVFQTFYSNKTVHTGGTVSTIYWTLDFTLPSLNLSRGEKKESILAKLGLPSYDFDSILVYPKYLPEVVIEVEGGKKYDDTVFLIFRNKKLVGIVAQFYLI